MPVQDRRFEFRRPQPTEQYTDYTHGVEIDQVFSVIEAFRANPDKTGSTFVDGKEVSLSAGNLENGPDIPVLDIRDDFIHTTLRGFRGKSIAVSVSYGSAQKAVEGSISLEEDPDKIDVKELAKIPDHHWIAIKRAVDEVEAGNLETDQAKSPGKIRKIGKTARKLLGI